MKRLSFPFVFSIALGFMVLGCEESPNPVQAPLSDQGVNLYKVGQKPGTWNTLTPVPTSSIGVEGMSVASIGNSIYAALGFDDSDDTRLMRIYDIARDTWTFGANAPGTSSEGAGIAHGGLFYNVGGRGAGFNALWSYNPTTDTWITLAPMPTGRAGLAVAVVGNTIYAIGGRTGTGGPNNFAKLAMVERYDIDAIGGRTGTRGANSIGKLAMVERYDIDAGTWSTAASLPSARSDLAAATVGGKIYVFGGFNAAGAVLPDVDVYNPVTNTWSTAPTDMPTARGGMYAVATKGGTVYVIGGWSGFPNTGLSTNEAYKVSQDEWTIGLPPMPTARAETGAANHNGKIYIVGGAQPGFGASVDANEVFKP